MVRIDAFVMPDCEPSRDAVEDSTYENPLFGLRDNPVSDLRERRFHNHTLCSSTDVHTRTPSGFHGALTDGTAA
jgi:hypothetical protein